MSELLYIISGRKRGTKQRYALTEPADMGKTSGLEKPVAKAVLKDFANIRINRYRADRPYPYFDITDLLRQEGGES